MRTEEKKRPVPCDCEDLDTEKHSFSKWWAELRKSLGGAEKVEYLTAREYYLAKRGEL